MNLLEIVRHCLAFDGEIYGEYVRDVRINKKDCQHINIRIDPVYLVPFLNVLSLKYNVYTNDALQTDHYTKNYLVDGVDLRVLPMKRFDFRAIPCDFDCNMLAINNESMYVWKVYPEYRSKVDKLMWLCDRIHNRTFCLAHKNYNSITPPGSIVQNAYKLVQQGWMMDSNILKNTSWVVNKWKVFPIEAKMKCTECSICQDEFVAEDIVVNTCCNHNFHWVCRNDSLGLRHWAVTEKQITCPTCRSFMF